MDRLPFALQQMQMPGMWDAICLVLLAVSALIGLWRGLVHEVMALLAWVAAFFSAQWGAVVVQQMLPQALQQAWSPQAGYLLAFALVFVAVLLLVGALASTLRLWIRQTGLGALDRVLGMGFGALRALVLLWVVTVAVLLTPLRSASWWTQSHAAGVLTASLQAAGPLLPPALRDWLPASMRQAPAPASARAQV